MPLTEILLNILLVIINIYLLKKNLNEKKLLTVLTSNIYIILIGIYFSVLIIESGEFVSEQYIYGYVNYASVYILIFMLIVSYTIGTVKSGNILLDKRRYSIEIAEYDKTASLTMLMLVVFVVSLNIIIIHILGFGKGYDRFDPFGDFYYKDLMKSINFYFSGISPYFVVRIKKKYRIYIIILLIVNGLIKMASFSVFFSLIVPIGIVYVKDIDKIKNKILEKKYVKKYILILILFLFLAIAVKLSQFSYNKTLHFYRRYVVQGQLFWGSINSQKEADIDYQLKYFNENFSKIKGFVISPDYGFGYLMVLISGDLAYRYMERNIRMTSGMPAILIVNFGLIASFIIFWGIVKIYIYYLKYYTTSLLDDNLLLFLIISQINIAFSNLLLIGEYGHFNAKFFFLVAMYIIGKKIMMVNRKIIKKVNIYSYST